MVRFIPPFHLAAKTTELETHYECRECGTNADADTETCPVCGGEVVLYEF